MKLFFLAPVGFLNIKSFMSTLHILLQYTVHPESINLIHVYAEGSYTVRTDVGTCT